MDAGYGGRNAVSTYILVALAVAFALIIGSIWIALSMKEGVRSTAKVDVSPPSVPAAVGAGPVDESGDNVRPYAYGGPGPVPESLAPSRAVVTVTPVAPEPEKPKALPAAPSTAASAAGSPRTPESAREQASIKDMFPMGDITRGQPELAHPYRNMPKLPPSFQYDGRVWAPTGAFARSGQVDLVPTGFALNGRDIYALANTGAPDQALFLEMDTGSDVYEIYRAVS